MSGSKQQLLDRLRPFHYQILLQQLEEKCNGNSSSASSPTASSTSLRLSPSEQPQFSLVEEEEQEQGQQQALELHQVDLLDQHDDGGKKQKNRTSIPLKQMGTQQGESVSLKFYK